MLPVRTEALLIDIDGVLTVGWEPVAGAVATFAELRRRSLPFRLATNTTSRSRQSVADALSGAGFPVVAGEILTAPVATAAHLRRRHPDAAVLVLSSGDLSADFTGIRTVGPGEAADVVVLGGAGLVYTHEELNHAFNLILDGAAFVAMHRNLYWRTARGLELDTGAYVTALEAATGRTATVIGKPAEAFFIAALEELGVPPETTLMVGDDLDNDVLGAQRCGISGCLVRTGKFRPDVLAASPVQPDLVIDCFADLFHAVID